MLYLYMMVSCNADSFMAILNRAW